MPGSPTGNIYPIRLAQLTELTVCDHVVVQHTWHATNQPRAPDYCSTALHICFDHQQSALQSETVEHAMLAVVSCSVEQGAAQRLTHLLW